MIMRLLSIKSSQLITQFGDCLTLKFKFRPLLYEIFSSLFALPVSFSYHDNHHEAYICRHPSQCNDD